MYNAHERVVESLKYLYWSMAVKIKKLLNREPDLQKEISQEKLILEVTESIFEAMEKEGKSKTDLALSMGRSTAFISQLLNGSRNMTLRTLADIAHALGIEPRFEIGFRDQLCEDRNWMSLVRTHVKPQRRILCYDFISDERSLSGEWVDTCIDERAA